MAAHELIDNTDKCRFEFQIDDQVAFIDYRKDPKRKRYALVHTEVPLSLRDQGIGTQLVKRVLETVREQDFQVLPYCPFIADYIKEHSEWMDLIPEDVEIG
ncbi:MAG: GNAT family N-acetyltransferase [Bacteroidota bacterium]